MFEAGIGDFGFTLTPKSSPQDMVMAYEQQGSKPSKYDAVIEVFGLLYIRRNMIRHGRMSTRPRVRDSMLFQNSSSIFVKSQEEKYEPV